MRFDLLSVLLVDDNHHMRRLLAEILAAIGVTKVAHASNGAEALQILRHRNFDIVITDFAMRPLSGIQFVRLLRKGPERANALVPVIMVTGHSTKARVAEARDAGVNEFLSKPVTPRGVVERIGRVIEHPRPFVRSDDYFGPDRRRRADPDYSGPLRRASDLSETRTA